jgi:hypothetical protein
MAGQKKIAHDSNIALFSVFGGALQEKEKLRRMNHQGAQREEESSLSSRLPRRAGK